MPATRIGILIPEYPGQTHVFFRREMLALAKLDVAVDVVSTRRLPPAIMSHLWSVQAMRETVYLMPPRVGQSGAQCRADVDALMSPAKCSVASGRNPANMITIRISTSIEAPNEPDS